MKYNALLLISIVFLFISCEENKKPNNTKKWSQEESIAMNSAFSEEEEDAIESFLKRRPDWKMTETGTGLRYFIYEQSKDSQKVEVNDVVTVHFTISLLNGKECYNSKTTGPETFVVEKTDIESGLHEGVKHLKLNDRAKFILPSHIAHGLIGDQDKIPPLETVVYDIHLINIDSTNEK